MYILVEFYICLNSKKLFRELEKYNMNVTDMGNGKVFAYGENKTGEQIAIILSICDRYGRYSHVSIDKGGNECGKEEGEEA